jgi:hypothetical protein
MGRPRVWDFRKPFQKKKAERPKTHRISAEPPQAAASQALRTARILTVWRIRRTALVRRLTDREERHGLARRARAIERGSRSLLRPVEQPAPRTRRRNPRSLVRR